MTMQPLGVDPPLLMGHGSAMETAAEQIPDPPAPFSPAVGSDELSAAIGREIPKAEAPIIEGLPPLKQSALEIAANIQTAAQRYSATDQRLAEEYQRHRFDMTPTSSGSVSGGGLGESGSAGTDIAGVTGVTGGAGAVAGGAGQMGGLEQMMGMPMQMMGMAASAPQSAMQGVQSAMQQVGGFGNAGGEDVGTESEPQDAPMADDVTDDRGKSESEGRAEPGQAGAERVPDAHADAASPGTPTVPPGRIAADERLDL